MSIKNSRRKADKRSKKLSAEKGEACFSSSGTNFHYDNRSKERTRDGVVEPFYSKKIVRMIRAGKAIIVKEDDGGKRIELPDGAVIVVSSNLKEAITYLGGSQRGWN